MKTAKLSTFIGFIRNKFNIWVMPVSIEMFFIVDDLSDYESRDFEDNEEEEPVSIEELREFWINGFKELK